jgi:hypothetical protein
VTFGLKDGSEPGCVEECGQKVSASRPGRTLRGRGRGLEHTSVDVTNSRTGVTSYPILLSEATSRAVLEVLLPDLGDLLQHRRALDFCDVLESDSLSVTEAFS